MPHAHAARPHSRGAVGRRPVSGAVATLRSFPAGCCDRPIGMTSEPGDHDETAPDAAGGGAASGAEAAPSPMTTPTDPSSSESASAEPSEAEAAVPDAEAEAAVAANLPTTPPPPESATAVAPLHEPEPPVAVALLHEPELPPADLVPPPSRGPMPRTRLAPAKLDLEPTEGLVHSETRVTLRGEHLYRESIVRFDGLIAMTVGAVEPRELTVRTPHRDQPGVVDVSVQNPGAALVVLGQSFRYVALAPPAISGVAPHVGAPKGGTELSVTGDGFVAGSVVLVNGVRAKTVLIDAHTLDAVTPPGAAGALVDVVVENPDGKRAVAPRAFAYNELYPR